MTSVLYQSAKTTRERPLSATSAWSFSTSAGKNSSSLSTSSRAPGAEAGSYWKANAISHTGLTILRGIEAGEGGALHLHKVAAAPESGEHVLEVGVDVVAIPANRTRLYHTALGHAPLGLLSHAGHM